MTGLTNLGTLGSIANATVVGGRLGPTLNTANSAFNNMPTLSFGFSGGDTLEGDTTNDGKGNGTEMTFNNNGALIGTGYTVLAVAARSFNNGALAPWGGNQSTGVNFFLGVAAYGTAENTGLAVGYGKTSSDAQGQYQFSQYYYDLYGGTPPMSGTMGGPPGPETAQVITAALNPAVGHSISVNGATVASNTVKSEIVADGGANYTSYLGTGNAEPDNGFFNGDLGEVVIFNTALTTAQAQAAETYLYDKWISGGTGGTMPVWVTSNASLPTGTPVTISGGGTLDLNNTSQTIGSLTSSDSTTAVSLGFGILTTGSDNTDSTFAGVITGASSAPPTALVKTGTGRFTLTGSNTYTGPTTISTGTLQLGSGGTTGSIDQTSGVTNNGNLAFNRSDNISFAPGISGSGSVAQLGSGAVILTGTNTYTGGTTVTSGTLDFATPAATPSAGIVTVKAGGYVALGAMLGASSPTTDTSATDATETAPNTSETVATSSTVSETAPLGGAAASPTGGVAGAAGAAAVPEPSTLILLGVAVVGLLGYVQRRKRT